MILANTEDDCRLPHFLVEYLDGGTFRETTLQSAHEMRVAWRYQVVHE